MGWWSTGIMGGDTPWDVAGTLEVELGVAKEDDYENHCGHVPDQWNDIERENWRKAFNKVSWAKLKKLVSFADEVGIQVLGLMIMSCGAKITKQAEKDIVRACKMDEWAMDDWERREEMRRLKDMVIEYNNTPTTIPQKTLMDRFAEVLDEPV